MDTTELAANQFRMTQTRDKLARDRVRDQQSAIRTHENVGKEVREAIKRIGGTLPEHLPPAEHIKHVENLNRRKRRVKMGEKVPKTMEFGEMNKKMQIPGIIKSGRIQRIS